MALAHVRSPFERVLLATDLTGPARSLLPLLAKACESIDPQVMCLHVRPGGGAEGGEASGGATNDGLDELFRYGQSLGLSMQTALRTGDPAEVIPAVAEETGASLIALGATSGPDLRTLTVGKVVEKVILRTALPVLVLPGSATPSRDVRHVLFAADRSPHMARTLRLTDALVRYHDARITALHVRAAKLPSGDRAQGHLREVGTEVARELDEWLRRHTRFPDSYKCRVWRARKTVQAIEDAIAELKPDLLVVSPHGKNFLERLVLGSTSLRLLRTATVPVLVV